MKLNFSYLIKILNLLLITAVFFALEIFTPADLKFFSAFGLQQHPTYKPIYCLSLILLLGFVVPKSRKGFFYFICFTLILLEPLYILACWIFFPLFYFIVKKYLNRGVFTAIILLAVAFFGLGSGYWLYQHGATHWFWFLIHMTFILKVFSWSITTRIYQHKYSLDQFLNFFFNPAFFFLTNDLNVLTPKKFIESEDQLKPDLLNSLKILLAGCFLILTYGVLKKYFFDQIQPVGLNIWLGGLVSIATAIIFHAANVYLQVSLLQAQGYNIEVDMNKPWLAISPVDYWNRMHYYVRDFIFEMIVKPLSVYVHRRNLQFLRHPLILALIVYIVFISSQIGYQPYRLERSWSVGLTVTGLFIVMFTTSYYFLKNRKLSAAWGRALTFGLLILGYSLIFKIRQGF